MSTKSIETAEEVVADTVKKEELKSSKNDILYIISSELVADESLNEREKDNYGDIDELVESIREHGVKSPLHGYNEKGLFHVTHGFRRSRAVAKLLAEGIEIKVPCIAKRKSEYSKENIIIDHFTLNTGMPLSTLEKANAVKKLIVYGYEPAQLSKLLSMTETYINSLLLLSNAPISVKKAINSGKIAASMAIGILRENKDMDKAAEVINKAITEANSHGKEKATKKDLINSGGSKKAAKKTNKKDSLLKLVKSLATHYNMSADDLNKLETAVKGL